MLPAAEVTAADIQQTSAARDALAGRPSERVLFDRPHADGPIWAVGTAWKASFDGRGFTAVPYFGASAPRNFPLRFELAAASVGGTPLQLADGEPSVVDGAVHTPRGALSEVVHTHLDTLEQSFVFDALPQRGAIAVDVRIDSEFAVAQLADGLRFENEFGHVDYTHAVAVDARGVRQPLAIEWTGNGAHMVIPAAFVEQAALPIVLDPVLNYWFHLASGIAVTQHDSDVATIQATGIGGRTLFVWQRNFSASDTDCYGLMFDANLGLVQTDFLIDASIEDWTRIAVAGHNYAQNFLVVAEIRYGVFLGNVYYIGGRGVAPNAAVGGLFNIERDGVVGFSGNNFHPDVGADPYFGVGRYTVVFQKDTGSSADIYMKQVSTAYALVTTSPIALTTAGGEDTAPSISKACGQSNGLPAYWFVTWQRTYSATDQDLYGRYINWNGALPGSVFPIATLTANETGVSPGSPIDVSGTRYWPVCYEYATSPGQQRDVYCRLFRSDGVQQAGPFVVSNNVPGADDRDIEVDSDGARFVAAFTTGTSGNPQSPQAVTLAYLPNTNTFVVEERTGLLTSSLDDYGECNVCAAFSGGSNQSPIYYVSFSEHASNTFKLVRFGGYTGGTAPFFQTRPSQCGSLSIQVTGSPTLGGSITATIGSAPFSGTILGVPGMIPLNVLGCACWQGVDQGIYLSNPLVWNVPNNAAYVGIVLSVQGWSITGTQCLGFVDLSDTVDFTIR